MVNFPNCRILCSCLLLSLCAATPSQADLRRAGETFGVIAAPARGSAVAYDSRNQVYLLVSSQGVVRGRFVTADGTPVGEAFVIQASGNYTHFPRVAYSPDAHGGAGGFLVTWHESDQPGGSTSIHGRIAAYPGALVTADVILGNDRSWWEAGPAVAYASGSREFLVVWRGRFGGANDITAARVNNAGQLVANFQITATGDYEDNASVAYNPHNDEFLVSYANYTTFAAVASQRVQAGTGQLLGPPIVLVQTGGTYITDTAFNEATNQFLVAWYQLPAGNVSGRLVDAGGALQGNILLLSSRYRANDGLSVAYNSVSESFLLASMDPFTAENGGVHLNGAAVPENSGVQFTGSGGTGNFYPRLAANANAPEWLLSTARSFTQTVAQRLQTDKGKGRTAPPPAPPTAPATRLVVDVPVSGGTYAGRVLVQGWAVDTAATSGTGVDAVHVWAFPAGGGAGIMVGAATMGLARLDVAAHLGSSRFTNSGYQIVARLAPGTYDIGVYARSTVANAFNTVKVIRVVVTPPPSEPRMVVDSPTVNQDVSQNVVVSGWAVDLAGAAGSSVDAVHVWAYPLVGDGHGAPTFVGVATVGVPRGDVAAAFGMPQLGASGFALSASVPRGYYDLVVFARSTVTGTFNNWIIVRIRVL